jgi:hypothetical protein
MTDLCLQTKLILFRSEYNMQIGRFGFSTNDEHTGAAVTLLIL